MLKQGVFSLAVLAGILFSGKGIEDVEASDAKYHVRVGTASRYVNSAFREEYLLVLSESWPAGLKFPFFSYSGFPDAIDVPALAIRLELALNAGKIAEGDLLEAHRRMKDAFEEGDAGNHRTSYEFFDSLKDVGLFEGTDGKMDCWTLVAKL